MAAVTIPWETCQVTGINPPYTYNGRTRLSYKLQDRYVAFNEIRYAAVPKGLERCRPPKPFIPGGETTGQSNTKYELDLLPKMCTQPDQDKPGAWEGSLDCLYMNVYLPRKPEEIKDLLPVLVYIHGGGFTFGCSAECEVPPDFIVQQELVFVTFNYRLGAFGFLNLGTDDVPGNAGLKDQVRALEWIRDNIICFRGDPTNVTLSGHSAGGTSVNHHLISEQSKHLFHKAIVQSGGIYCPWGTRGHQCERKQMLLRDKKFNELRFNPDKSEEFQKYTADLVQEDKSERHPEGSSPLYGPTVEKGGKNAFIPDTVEKMMENLINFDKPVMAGIAKGEGLFRFLNLNATKKYGDLVGNDEKFCKFLVDNLRWSYDAAKKHFGVIKQKYFPEHRQQSPEDRDDCLQNFLRDIYFRRFYDNFKFGPKKTLPEKLYVYRFDHISQMSGLNFCPLNNFTDATHGDELNYLYCSWELRVQMENFIFPGHECHNPEIRVVTNHMCSLWANFCRDGVPKSNYDPKKVQWRSHTEEAPCFLSISKDLTLIEAPLFDEEWVWLNHLVSNVPILDSPVTSEGPEPFPGTST